MSDWLFFGLTSRIRLISMGVLLSMTVAKLSAVHATIGRPARVTQISIYKEFMNAKNDRTCSYHAETSAYFSVPPMLRRGLILVVVRVKNDKLKLSSPCINCQRFALKRNIRIYYSDDDGNIRKW